MPRRRTFKPERIAKMSARDIMRIKDERLNTATANELKLIAERSAQLFLKRQKQIEKAGLSNFAFANKYLKDVGFQFSSTRNELLRDVARYRQFFGAKSSTKQGIIKVMTEQEERLSNLAGQEIKFATDEERTRFWEAYDEFMHQHAEYDNKQGSDRVQQYLAQSGFWTKRGFTADDLIDLLNKVQGKKPGKETES